MDTTSFSVEPTSTLVHLADGCVRVDGAYVSLSRRETQVVMKIACMTRPIPIDELAAAIFENAAPVKNANNNIKVFINRIRHKLGGRAIVRSSLGYRLGNNVQSDVTTFSNALLGARTNRVLDDHLFRMILATLSQPISRRSRRSRFQPPKTRSDASATARRPVGTSRGTSMRYPWSGSLSPSHEALRE